MNLSEAARRMSAAVPNAEKKLEGQMRGAVRKTQQRLSRELFAGLKRRSLGQALDKPGSRPPLEVLVQDWKIRSKSEEITLSGSAKPGEFVGGVTVVGLGATLELGGRTKPHRLGAGQHPGGPVHGRRYIGQAKDEARAVFMAEMEKLRARIAQALQSEVLRG